MLKLMRNVHIWNVNFIRKEFNINTFIYGYLYKMSCQSTKAVLVDWQHILYNRQIRLSRKMTE